MYNAAIFTNSALLLSPYKSHSSLKYTLCDGWGCQQRMHESDWHFSDTPLDSDWLYLARSSGFLQTKLQPLGGATDFYTDDLYLILLPDQFEQI